MHPTVPTRTFLLCLAVLILASLPCLAQTYPGSGTQFTNGQNGTPNLPLATSCTIDKTHLAFESSDAAFVAQGFIARKKFFSNQFKIEAHRDNTLENQQALADLINKEAQATQQDKQQQNLTTSYLYFGSEVRVGSGRPIYALPALSYGDDRFGVQLGGEAFYEFGTANSRGYDSVGLSLKVEVTDVTRGLARRIAAVKDAQKQIDAAHLGTGPLIGNGTDIEALQKIVSVPLDQSKIQALQNIADRYPFFANVASPNQKAPPNTKDQLTEALATLDTQSSDLLTDYARKTRYPIVSVIAGNRFVNDGGSLPQAGLSASQLFPFSYGGPGMTLLGVVQGFRDRFQGDPHREAERFGTALIFQDHTPSLVNAKDDAGKPVLRLGKTWNVKEGLEYTSPILGLKETYAAFITYRDVHSYGEITLTAGKDGRRKDYLDISIGRSFIF